MATAVAHRVRSLGTQGRRRRVEAGRIRNVLTRGGLSMVFQPIVRLTDGMLVGLEGLSRFRVYPARPPSEWFAAATGAGVRMELELAAVSAALAELDSVPRGVFLAVNVSPPTVCSVRLHELISKAPDRVVVEVTEHAPVDDYASLSDCVTTLRGRGTRLAIDDVGAGFSSLRHILRLAPELVKLDASLTFEIAGDPARRALASSLVAFARGIEARIVAEGIEAQEDLDVLRELGVDYGQGYHLGAPAPPAVV
jgi:EAL domain-containing protein (putative c-di-GMP-specific phosphodiesterase class I)